MAALALAVHARVLHYPFIQDDWGYLERALTTDTLQLLRAELSPFDRELHRPVWPLYFLVAGKVFALDPRFTHVVSLALHVAASLLVVRVITRLTADSRIGWLTGILYASASFVHMDPMMWASGIFESASVLLALVSVACFLEGHPWRAAFAYAAALLFKESVAFLPLVLVAIARHERDGDAKASAPWRATLLRLMPIWIVMVAYAALKLAGPSPFGFPPNHPYAMRPFGEHLLSNALKYGRWSIGALFPTRLLPPVLAAGLLGGLAALLGAGHVVPRFRERAGRPPLGTVALTVWLLGGMSVYIFLPNHVYRYYLTVSLPALIALILSSLSTGARLLHVPDRLTAVIMIILAGSSVASSFAYFRGVALAGLNQPYIEGTNNLVPRAESVAAIRRGLMTAYPRLPPQTVILIRGAQVWALNQHSAPRLWYGDQTIRVYDVKNLFHESGRWLVEDANERVADASTGGVPGRIALAGRHVVLFELTDRGFVERSLARELGEISLAKLYAAHFGHIPERHTLEPWIAQHGRGASLVDVSNALATSPEFLTAHGALTNEQFVTLMYRNALGRDPDPGGLKAWISHLERNALTRGDVALGFVMSREYRNRDSAPQR